MDFFTSPAVGFVVVGACWGCTNPLLKSGTEKTQERQVSGSAVARFFNETVSILTTWNFIIPFAINQLGSVLYIILLGAADISMAVPICNSLTFVFTAMTSILIGEPIPRPLYTLAGCILVVIGVGICVASQ